MTTGQKQIIALLFLKERSVLGFKPLLITDEFPSSSFSVSPKPTTSRTEELEPEKVWQLLLKRTKAISNLMICQWTNQPTKRRL